MGIRVVIADDHPVVREGMKSLLSAAGLSVVAEAEDGRTALGLVRELRPDVLLTDIALPGLSGLELCRQVRRRFPQVRVVLISMFDDPAWKAEAAHAGASAYVLKGEEPQHLVETVRRAAEGEALLPQLDGPRLPLTPREREVVQLIVEGKKPGEIAQILSRSLTTVRAHKASAMHKLGAHSTADLIQKALALGLVRVPSAKEVVVGED